MTASTNQNDGHRSRRHDFHAERIRDRKFWRGILLAVFLLAGAAMVAAAMNLLGR